MFIWDPQNNLFAEMEVNENKNDIFGKIYKVNDFFMQQFLATKSSKTKLYSRVKMTKDSSIEVSRIAGSWTDSLFINDEMVWKIEKSRFKITSVPRSLPSDSIKREDLVFKKNGNFSAAEAYKEKLKLQDLRDIKLRAIRKKNAKL
jgi:hypothetical protein